jgi:hypothetical protein
MVVNPVNLISILGLVKILLLVLLFLYAVFALITYWQVGLMTRTIKTPINPIVRALAIVHAGFGIAFFVLAIGSL